MHLKTLLPPRQRRSDQTPDFVDLGVRHRKATDRRAAAVNHDQRAGAAVGLVEGIRKPKVERAMPGAIRIERRSIDRVEALRRLQVALLQFGAKPAGPAANGINREAMKHAIALHPQFQFEFSFEYSD